ncbi:helix-turn-helix transcriptional regulator [Elizabethkingia anophelis]|uniref:helix-turn-helix domain-containing protein n=1 Tax=Flavobacterium sp. 38-13 TaxID=1896168 RepID=UPI00095E5DE3|nr:helix-turn-helix transcriptional regulator [Flavobacterium sp. 38-13]MCT4135643.1 helix-turn-helix transcriptional regulator [Elizabethkingia anophelis]MCT4146361.1 helix-turn-helix transcriptional regulator [Elizabethkingia anophelis]OJX51886.1 MAG: transcriptional regulator [Flavobacterium sp. 38-13]
MIHTDMPNKKIHQGRNIKRFREMLGIKQDALAYELGEDWNQKKISLLEQKESVEKDILEQVAKILKLPIEAIENFDEEQAVNVIANTYSFQDFKDNAVASGFSYQPSFNPIDKMVDLYERMLQQQKEMIEKLEKLIEGK